jgi:hypothetical protein
MDRTMTVVKCPEELGVIEAGLKVFEDFDWNGKRAASIRQGIMRRRGRCQPDFSA